MRKVSLGEGPGQCGPDSPEYLPSQSWPAHGAGGGGGEVQAASSHTMRGNWSHSHEISENPLSHSPGIRVIPNEPLHVYLSLVYPLVPKLGEKEGC